MAAVGATLQLPGSLQVLDRPVETAAESGRSSEAAVRIDANVGFRPEAETVDATSHLMPGIRLNMRFVAIATSIGALSLYGALSWRDPAYTLLAPRGGVFTLSVALLFANVLIWLSAQNNRTPNERFQFALAGWIWLLVQVGGLVYELHLASPASVASQIYSDRLAALV